MPVGVEEDRGESVVLAAHDEFAGGLAEQFLGERTGCHVGIEDHQREARGVEEQHHHDGERGGRLPRQAPIEPTRNATPATARGSRR